MHSFFSMKEVSIESWPLVGMSASFRELCDLMALTPLVFTKRERCTELIPEVIADNDIS
jgi:hypothetical protein